MKTQNKEVTRRDDKKQPKGDCKQARLAIDLKGSMTMEGKKEDFAFDLDLTITTENVRYAIQAIAGGIAQAADRVAAGALS